MSDVLATLILVLGISGISFTLVCLYRRRVTDRGLVIAGSLVIINFILLVWLICRLAIAS